MSDNTDSSSAPAHIPAPELPDIGSLQSAPLTGLGNDDDEDTPSPPKVSNVTPDKSAARSTPKPTENIAEAAAKELNAVPKDTELFNLLNNALGIQQTQQPKFYLMITPEDEHPYCEEFTELATLVSRIKELVGTLCYLSVFSGVRLPITAGEHKYLVTPYFAYPLFDAANPKQNLDNPTGWVGPVSDMPHSE